MIIIIKRYITAIQMIAQPGGGIIEDRIADRKPAALTLAFVVIVVVVLILVVEVGRSADPRVKEIGL